MPNRVTLISSPRLRSSTAKLAGLLLNLKHEALFLDFSREIEEYIRMLAEGLPYSYVLAELKRSRLLPQETSETWEYHAEPLLRQLGSLKRRNPRLEVRCYGSSSYEYFSSQLAVKIALLTMRAMASSRVDVAEWRRLLEEEAEAGREALEEEAELLASWAERYKTKTCVSLVPKSALAGKLRERGLKVEVLEVEPDYKPTPLETLKVKVAEGKAGDLEIERLVKAHVNYVRKFVLTSRNLDEAYRRWASSGEG